MNRNKIVLSLVSGIVLLLSGCGSDSAGGTTSVAKNTAFYVDSAIEGVTVECAGYSSVTASDGKFSYENGAECHFKVGSVLLRTEGGISNGQIVFEDNVRTAQFLQTLDMDGNPENGISIATQTATVLADIGISSVPQNDVLLAEVHEAMDIANTGYHGRFVTAAEAQDHMEKSYEKYFDQPLYQDMPNSPSVPGTTPDNPSIPSTPEVPHL